MNFLEQKLKLMRELARRRELPINTYTPDSTPQRNQLSFHESDARYRLAFGGNRAGKSVVTSYEVAAWARGIHRFQSVPPGPKKIYVVSSEYRTLYEGIYNHLSPEGAGKAMKFIDRAWIKAKAAKVPGAMVPIPGWMQVYTAHHADGTPVDPRTPAEERPYSSISFISGDGGEQARRKMQGAMVDLVVIDEEIEQVIFEELQMRILDSDGRMCISATLVRSEEWLMNLEDRAEEGDQAVSLVRLDTESSTHISASAKKDILSQLTEEEYAVRVKGKSRRQFGLVYGNFDQDHVFKMDSKFPNGIPEDWPIIVASDPGFRVHAALWCAIDVTQSTLYFFRELYQKEATLEEVCKSMANAEGYELVPLDDNPHSIIYVRRPIVDKPETPMIRLVDPAGLRKLEDGSLSIAMQMAAYFDTPVAPANNDLHSGIEAARKLLSINPLTNKPHAMFEGSLRNFFNERRKYRLRGDTSGRNAHSTRAEPLRKDNHLMDCFRYTCTYVSHILGGEVHEHIRRNRNHAIQVPAALKMADRLVEHAEFLRERDNRAVASSSPLGSEW